MEPDEDEDPFSFEDDFDDGDWRSDWEPEEEPVLAWRDRDD